METQAIYQKSSKVNSSNCRLKWLVRSRLIWNDIYNGDSFKLCEQIEAKSVDMILEDMPYNTTACEWDTKIDLTLYWETRLRILKPTGVVVLTGSQPFTSDLINSNRKMFRYEWIWNKQAGANFLNVKIMPLKTHENISVFYNSLPTYNPIMQYKREIRPIARASTNTITNHETKNIDIGHNFSNKKYPFSVLEYHSQGKELNSAFREHPTQKPVGLFEYLIRTYTNENDLVFDGFGGSGTTAIAAHRAKRNFIVIEKDLKYYENSKQRLETERAQQVLF